MLLNKEKIFFAGSVLAQFVVLAWMIFSYQSIVMGGTEVILKTEPVDPRDVLRGQYVALRYDISTLRSTDCLNRDCFGGETFRPGETVYVALHNNGGIWNPYSAGSQKPISEVFIKGKVTSVSGNSVFVAYGIESYFVSPEKAKELETAARRGTLLMKVVLDDGGNAVVRGVADGAGGAPVSGGPQSSSRDARRIADIQQIRLALGLYFDQNNFYPESMRDLIPQTMPSLPSDPLTGRAYNYYLCGEESYHLGADLENSASGALQSDRDIAALCPEDSVHGPDNFACDGIVSGRFCYDIAVGEITTKSAVNLPPKVIVVFPNQSQIFMPNQTMNIRWNVQKAPPEGKFQIIIYEEISKKPVMTADLGGKERAYNVLLLASTFAPNKFYRVKVLLKDSAGKAIASDESDRPFGISY